MKTYYVLMACGALVCLPSCAINALPDESPPESVSLPGVRPGGEFMTAWNANCVKLDFIPAEERLRRQQVGYGWLRSPAGTYAIEGHGASDHMTYRTGESISPEEISKWVRRDTRYVSEMPIYLFSCDTGSGPHPFAQRLADVMSVPVVAPTERIWMLKGGGSVVGGTKTEGKALGVIPVGKDLYDPTKPGNMKTFLPAAAMMIAGAR